MKPFSIVIASTLMLPAQSASLGCAAPHSNGTCGAPGSDSNALLQSKVRVENTHTHTYTQMHDETRQAPCGYVGNDNWTGECELNYSLSSVNDSVINMSFARNSYAEQMNKIKKQAFEECMQTSNNGIEKTGGWCYNVAESILAKQEDRKVDKDFYIPPGHVLADEQLVKVLANKILRRPDGSCCDSLIDMGAGVGQIGHALRAQLPNIEYFGVDGGGNVEDFTKGYVKFGDLTRPLGFKPMDWVLSSEVGEHIPNQYEKQVIANLHAHNCKGIVLTWAIPGQWGKGHVNCHSNDYLIEIFKELGYRKNDDLSAALRANHTVNSWLANTAMVFERLTAPLLCN